MYLRITFPLGEATIGELGLLLSPRRGSLGLRSDVFGFSDKIPMIDSLISANAFTGATGGGNRKAGCLEAIANANVEGSWTGSVMIDFVDMSGGTYTVK